MVCFNFPCQVGILNYDYHIRENQKKKVDGRKIMNEKKNDGFKYIRQNNILLRGPLSLNNQ